MLKLPQNLIAEIAELAHSGLVVCVHKQTHDLVKYPENNHHTDTAEMQAEYDKVHQNPNDYLQVKGMNSYEAYEVCKDFIATVENKSLQNALKACLHTEERKLANFRHCVRNSEYEQKWFVFEAAAQVDYVKRLLER